VAGWHHYYCILLCLSPGCPIWFTPFRSAVPVDNSLFVRYTIFYFVASICIPFGRYSIFYGIMNRNSFPAANRIVSRLVSAYSTRLWSVWLTTRVTKIVRIHQKATVIQKIGSRELPRNNCDLALTFTAIRILPEH